MLLTTLPRFLSRSLVGQDLFLCVESRSSGGIDQSCESVSSACSLIVLHRRRGLEISLKLNYHKCTTNTWKTRRTWSVPLAISYSRGSKFADAASFAIRSTRLCGWCWQAGGMFLPLRHKRDKVLENSDRKSPSPIVIGWQKGTRNHYISLVRKFFGVIERFRHFDTWFTRMIDEGESMEIFQDMLRRPIVPFLTENKPTYRRESSHMF